MDKGKKKEKFLSSFFIQLKINDPIVKIVHFIVRNSNDIKWM